jgi:ubiquinone/menaquinone biosynthesis C-methylase UbiE
MGLLFLPDVSQVWRRDPPWAAIYTAGVANEPVARIAGRLFWGTDIRLLYRATAVIGEQPDGAAILDIPCGGGIALRGLRRGQGVRYVAADISDAMLERTTREAERRGVRDIVELRRADVEALPFDDGEFDVCVSFTGLHCFPHPRLAVMELGRVVRPGGRLSASALLTDAGVRYKPALAAARVSRLMGPSASGPELESWLDEAGFRDVELVRSGALGYVTARRAGRRKPRNDALGSSSQRPAR